VNQLEIPGTIGEEQIHSMLVLAGDIGGTFARLAYCSVEDEKVEIINKQVYPSRQFRGLFELIGEFMSLRREVVDAACFSIAGPVRDDHIVTPNLGWVVDAGDLSRRLSIRIVHVINDLEANAYGIASLKPSDFAVLNQGAQNAVGNAAVISAGTGLGEAGLFWDGKGQRPFATEGGHTDFAPRNRLEVELFLYLLERFGRVSCERVVSGPGLHNIYMFLRDKDQGAESEEVVEAMREESPPAVISRFALTGRCALCVRALDLFVSLYGAEAGNLALKVMATGGVFVGGGIAPKIIERLKGPLFMETFTAKGRLKSLMESMPVRVILNDMTALQGAARYIALIGS
jgi:glucokinase